MKKELYKALATWPKGYISEMDLSILIGKTDPSRYGIVNRALKEGTLLRVRRGLYLIRVPGRDGLVNAFEIAQTMYGPSVVSLESALSYHGLIPEAVYTTTSITIKKSYQIETTIGVFSYKRVPCTSFLLGVQRVDSFFIASPWRAIADLIMVYKKHWNSFRDMCDDLRIDTYSVLQDEKKVLLELLQHYPSPKTRSILKRLLESIHEF
jgi:hypothetical protein